VENNMFGQQGVGDLHESYFLGVFGNIQKCFSPGGYPEIGDILPGVARNLQKNPGRGLECRRMTGLPPALLKTPMPPKRNTLKFSAPFTPLREAFLDPPGAPGDIGLS